MAISETWLILFHWLVCFYIVYLYLSFSLSLYLHLQLFQPPTPSPLLWVSDHTRLYSPRASADHHPVQFPGRSIVMHSLYLPIHPPANWTERTLQDSDCHRRWPEGTRGGHTQIRCKLYILDKFNVLLLPL